MISFIGCCALGAIGLAISLCAGVLAISLCAGVLIREIRNTIRDFLALTPEQRVRRAYRAANRQLKRADKRKLKRTDSDFNREFRETCL